MKRIRNDRSLRAEPWPLPLLLGLRSGKLRIPALASQTGLRFPQLRLRLRQLTAAQRTAVFDGLEFKLQRGIAAAASGRVEAIDLALAHDCALLRALPAHPEAVLLAAAGRDRFGRQHWLQPVARRAWALLRHAAGTDGVNLELVSSFRSIRDQVRILARKLRHGQSLDEILRVNAPPGYSEHHSGCAIDLAVPGAALLTEDFEGLPAFAWLLQHASRFGFHLSYPRENRFGFIYEPWHWCYHGLRDSTLQPTEIQLSTTGP